MGKSFKNTAALIHAAVLVFAAVLSAGGCMQGNEFEAQYNIPEGIYISGSASKFSTETASGALTEMETSRLYGIMTWLRADGEFFISMVGPDNQATVYGGGERNLRNDGAVIWSLGKGGGGMTVSEDGFYHVIYSAALGELTLVPVRLTMAGTSALKESGENEIAFLAPEYDNLNHRVTWRTSADPETMLGGEYVFRYTPDGWCDVPLEADRNYRLTTVLTGTGSSPKTNVLSENESELSSESSVNLKLKKKGSYVVTVSYDVRNAKFYGTIDGTEYIVPEPSGMSETLYMTGDNYGGGDWDSDDAVRMTPCGTPGNGVFWTLAYLSDGQGVKWSATGSDGDSFCSGDTNEGFHVEGDKAVPDEGGAYLIFVDLYNRIVAFESPELYATGDCFGSSDVKLNRDGGKFSVTTLAEGNLRMYAVCSFNERDWDSMEFGVLNDRIVYRGTGTELAPVPVAEGVPVEIDLAGKKALIKVNTSGEVPFSGQIYMITDEYGDMNWGTPSDVISLNKVWNDDTRWIYVRYFSKGAKIRFSSEMIFGRGEFTGLGADAGGYGVEDGYAIIPESGTYGICVNLGGRKVSIQPVVMHTYGTASNDTWGTKLDDPFSLAADGVTLTYTVPNTGRLRFNPVIEGFDFSSWQREYYIAMDTMDILQRPAGTDEPNASYVWEAGTVINLDFRTLKAEIIVP